MDIKNLIKDLPPCKWVLYEHNGRKQWKCHECGAGKRGAADDIHMNPPLECRASNTYKTLTSP